MGVHAQHKHHLFFFFLSFDDSNVTSQKNNILFQICTLSWHLAAGFAHALPELHSFGEFSVKYLFCHSNVQPMVSKMYMTVLKTSNRWNSSQNFFKICFPGHNPQFGSNINKISFLNFIVN